MESDMTDWMRDVEDGMPLSELRIAGTHDSATGTDIHGWNRIGRVVNFAARCQRVGIGEQLEMGVRYLDIRLKLDEEQLNCYHGIARTGIDLHDVLMECSRFLYKYPSEAIIVKLQREDTGIWRREGSDLDFIQALNKEINLFESWVYKGDMFNLLLGRIRGKIVFRGIVNNDSMLFDYPLLGVREQWESYKEKCTTKGYARKKDAVLAGMKESCELSVLFVNQANAIGSVPVLRAIPYPKRMAVVMNCWLAQNIPKVNFYFKGVLLLDFPPQELIDKIIEGNFSNKLNL